MKRNSDFNRCPNSIVLKNADKLKLVNEVIEREKRGWEPVHPIQKRFRGILRAYHSYNHWSKTSEYDEGVEWYITMRKSRE